MNTLADAWRWYETTRDSLRRMGRLADKHWPALPWDGELGRDDEFRLLEAAVASADAQYGRDFLDDLAVVVLFSVFESAVREAGLSEYQAAAPAGTHPFVEGVLADAADRIREGSFFPVLNAYKVPKDDDVNNLVEQVNQVRKYRNWVAHGRRGAKPSVIAPKPAYDRLDAFLKRFIPDAAG